MHPRGTIKAPASPHTTRMGGAYQNGHPGRSESEGAARELKNGWGSTAYSNIYLTYNIL